MKARPGKELGICGKQDSKRAIRLKDGSKG